MSVEPSESGPNAGYLAEFCRRTGENLDRVRAELRARQAAQVPRAQAELPDQVAGERRSAEVRDMLAAVLKLQRQLDDVAELLGQSRTKAELRAWMMELLFEDMVELVQGVIEGHSTDESEHPRQSEGKNPGQTNGKAVGVKKDQGVTAS